MMEMHAGRSDEANTTRDETNTRSDSSSLFTNVKFATRLPQAPFTQDAEHLASGARKLWDTLWSMGVFTQLASNIEWFARKSASASCVNGALFGGVRQVNPRKTHSGVSTQFSAILFPTVELHFCPRVRVHISTLVLKVVCKVVCKVVTEICSERDFLFFLSANPTVGLQCNLQGKRNSVDGCMDTIIGMGVPRENKNRPCISVEEELVSRDQCTSTSLHHVINVRVLWWVITGKLCRGGWVWCCP